VAVAEAAVVAVAAASMAEAADELAEAAPRFAEVVAEDIAAAVGVLAAAAWLGAHHRCRVRGAAVVAGLRSMFRVADVKGWAGFRRRVADQAADRLHDPAAAVRVAGKLRGLAAVVVPVAVRRVLVEVASRAVDHRSVISTTS
jgi:hypothetical protein